MASLAGAQIRSDRTIDGMDISSLMIEDNPSASRRDEFIYYDENDIEAVRDRRWKLHVRKGGHDIHELYDLESDIGESVNLFDSNPDVVAELTARIESWRRELGDEASGVTGENVRPPGRVDNPVASGARIGSWRAALTFLEIGNHTSATQIGRENPTWWKVCNWLSSGVR